MTINPKSISIRQCLQRLNLASEEDLRSRILEVPAFLNGWAEFRDDFLWGCPEGLSGHVYLKVVVPATLRELSDPNPTSFYIYRTVSGPASYATPFAKVDKTHFTLSDHYIRLLLQTLPSLSRDRDGIFRGKMGTDADREACIEALAFTIHALRKQYRPEKRGSMARWLEKNVPDSRHVDKAREFENPRYSEMIAQIAGASKQEEGVDDEAAATKEEIVKSHGRSDSATSRDEVGGHGAGKHVVTSLPSPGFNFTPWPHPPLGVLPPRPTWLSASSVEGQGMSPPAWQFPRLIPSGGVRTQPNQMQQQQQQQRQHQHQIQNQHQIQVQSQAQSQSQSQNQSQNQSQSQSQSGIQNQNHHQNDQQPGAKQRLNKQSLSKSSESSASSSPKTPSLSATNKTTTPTIMGISNRSLKRNHSATSLTAPHNNPVPKIAKTDLPATTTTNDKAGALNTEVKKEPGTATEQNAVIPFTSLSLSSENDVTRGMDQVNMMQEGNEQNMSPHTLILLEQVRVARRGYAKAEAELAIEDNIIAHAGAAAMVEAGQAGWRDWVVKKADMEVWRKRCENSLRELRGVAGVNELESVWAGLEAAKRL
ncbi:hypothetical protein DIS24_g7487 [Lasiodiplodia hormozganensis]|uniref:Uncharacterized protein n=1 Tax=Lasiodiplodia hormozganensis TaxID=869390 RepID=A0AA39Y7X2_9PEZI|nr:hypothetical protein DIS24_g7487 [Lasiodiplodia hormozganensis]